MDEFCKAADIIREYLKETPTIQNPLKFASDAISLYLINAENQNAVGFSERILRETIADLLTDSDETMEVMAQIPISPIEYDQPPQRKRRGSVSASGNPFAPLTEYEKPENVSNMLHEILANTRLIARTMDSEQMRRLVGTMFMEQVKKGETLIRQGEYGKTMYLVESGEFQILQDKKLRATLRANSLFGEISLLYSCPRTASVVCSIDATVWVVTSDAYAGILMADQRKSRELICEVLEENTKYALLSAEEKNRVLCLSHQINFCRGETIEISESGVFLVLTSEDSTFTRGSLLSNGTTCSCDISVLFIPETIYSILEKA